MRFSVRVIVCVLLCGIGVESWALSDGEAINKAGRQRMLSQRIAKNYLMLGAGLNTVEAQQQLADSVKLFEQQYQELQGYASTPELKTALDEVLPLWQGYRALALAAPEHARAAELIAQSDAVLAASEKVVKMIEKQNGSASAHLVNVCGRQRMLSQRIARDYVALAWHVESPGLRGDFDHSVKEFDAALTQLRATPQNSPEIGKSLQHAQAQWNFSRAGFELSEQSRYVPLVIYKTTDTLLGQMNSLTQDYQTLMVASRR